MNWHLQVAMRQPSGVRTSSSVYTALREAPSARSTNSRLRLGPGAVAGQYLDDGLPAEVQSAGGGTHHRARRPSWPRSALPYTS